MATTELVLDIDGMTCASCVQKVERALGSVEGVEAAAVNLATRTATVRGQSPGLAPLIGAVEHVGYVARPHDGARDPAEEERAYRRRLVVAAPLTIAVLALTFLVGDEMWAAVLSWALATPVVFWAGWPFFRTAARAARHGTTTMDTLVALGAASAYGYSVSQVVGAGSMGEPAMHYFDTAAVIVTLILVGRFLEARARMTAGDASRALLARGASQATIRTEDGERTIAIEDLQPGMRAIVRPGEKIPADGVVRAGASWVDLSLLTGESVPVDVGPGDEVIGASINGYGRLEIFVTKVGANATLGEIVRALQAAQASKAAGAAAGRSRLVGLRAVRARAGGGDVRGLGGVERCDRRPSAPARDGRGPDRVPVRAGTRHAGRDRRGRRTCRGARCAVQGRRGGRGDRRRRRRAARQDRHGHGGRDDARRCARGERGGAR